MSTLHLLFSHEYRINDNIAIRIPTVEEVLEHEDDYYGMVHMITATPYDMMVQLDDLGIDFTTINDYELFLILFNGLQLSDTSLIFGDLDISNFKPMVNPKNNLVVLRDSKTGIIIDRAIYEQICKCLRTINFIEKNTKKPGNQDAKEYLIKRMRAKMKRRQRKKNEESQLENLIVSLVNTSEFPYDFEGVRGITIYQFNRSLYQVIHKKDVDYRMHGVYVGTVSTKDLKPGDLNWLHVPKKDS